MPRPKKPGAPEPKKRSRNGCWPCKARKVKCGEEHPSCLNCQRTGETCDYSIRLNWEGRRVKRPSFSSTDSAEQSSPAPSRPSRSFAIINQTFSNPDGTARGGSSFVSHTRGASLLATNKRRTSGDSRPVLQTIIIRDEDGESETGHGSSEWAEPYACPPESVAETRCTVNSLPTAGFVSSPVFADGLPSPDQATKVSSPTRTAPFQLPTQRPHKRSKSSVEAGDTEPLRQPLLASPASMSASSPQIYARFQNNVNLISIDSPMTPATPSSFSDEDHRTASRGAYSSPASPDIRRLSVNSLLSGPPGPNSHQQDVTSFYGYDLGERDKDMGKNDDASAIAWLPPTSREQSETPSYGGLEDVLSFDFRFGDQTQKLAPGTGGYYKAPVPIRIPRTLEPLPSKLQDNPMNLLYFHHFLNHTARVLMPYDDQQSNPFRTILPQMATKNEHLLSLLLAYSASHRAKLLHQKEPEMRMAHWVQDIFPALRQALNDSAQIVSNANLATAIMLASLEIISPKAFGYPIPWQEHLNLARNLMKKRLGDLRRMHSSSIEDQVCSFLWSWFAYLDILGSLSGGPRKSDSSSAWLVDYSIVDTTDDPDEIDCILGFTTRCVPLLAQTAELARRCDTHRIGPDHRLVPGWKPPTDIESRALRLDFELRDSIRHPSHPCKHIADSVDGRDRAEMTATNEAFHWAGLVHLHRRVLGKPSDHADVQGAVRSIIVCMEGIRRGGSAEMGFLFPMFTAGCDTSDAEHRMKILDRFKSVESNGMTQVHKARKLMEKVWEQGLPWETLLKNEFIG